MTSKTPEEWIIFLLTLIDHTSPFKPDWEGFAQNTGLYKRGKFVRQAYDGLRKKYAQGQFSTPTNQSTGSIGVVTAPKTPSKSTKSTPRRDTSGKRKIVEDTVDDNDNDNVDVDMDDVSMKPAAKKARKTKTDTKTKTKTKAQVAAAAKNAKDTKDEESNEVDNDGDKLDGESEDGDEN